MNRTNLLRVGTLLMTLSTLIMSCSTPVRFTYGAENIKGNAVMDADRLLADYGKFAIQYTSGGGVTIINQSDSMMYIDMAESYYVNNGTAQQLYTNSVTTNFSSGTQGATVNLGSVTNALGVGGAVGKLAQGVNVGGSNTSGSSIQIFEERYISIPPLSRKSVKSVSFEPVNSGKWGQEFWQETQEKNDFFGVCPKEGTYAYGKYHSPSQEYIFAYTFDPNGKFQSTRDLFYVMKIEIDKSLKYKAEKANQITKYTKTGKDRGNNFVGALFGGVGAYAALMLIIFASAGLL